MAAGIFIVQQDPSMSQFVPMNEGGKMIVTLTDYNDTSHLRFVVLDITSELPTFIHCEDRWYSNHASWNETLPEGEKPRSYYRQKEDFQPPEGVRTFVSETPLEDTTKGLKSILVGLHAFFVEALLSDFYRR